MIKTKYLIIGAGLTGATLANCLGKDYIILEKSNVVGGLCKSFYVKDFVFDCGGHFMHGFALREQQKEQLLQIKKISKIAYKNHFIDYPFQNNIHQLSEKEYKRCMQDFEKRHKYKPLHLKNYLYHLYGKRSVDLFLKPYNEKLYCTKLNALDKDCFGRFFPKPNENKSYNDTFYYDALGCEHFFSSTFHSLNNSNIIFNCFYTRIDVLHKIVYTNQGAFQYEYLINTSPFIHFYKAIYSNSYKKIKKYFKANKVLVINIGFNKNTSIHSHWLYVKDPSINFYRIGFYSNITSANKLSIYAEVALKQSARVYKKRQMQRVLAGLKKLNIIDDSFQVEAYNFVVCDPAYVHINRHSNLIVSNFKNIMEKEHVYTIGRYGNWEYSSMIDNVKEAECLGLKIKEQNK